MAAQVQLVSPLRFIFIGNKLTHCAGLCLSPHVVSNQQGLGHTAANRAGYFQHCA